MKKISEMLIDITGNACNINGQPAVVSDKEGIFFMKGMTQWEKGWEYKKVRVIGDFIPGGKTQTNTISNPVVQLL
ncbi:MAG: hypothetical protein V4722_02780 [Bacteroidota bacterium]